MVAPRLLLAVLCALPLAAAAQSQTVTLAPAADTTLYENSGTESNGVGVFLFVGRTAQAGTPRRRALLRFDLSAIPADAVVQSVSLRLNMSRTIVGNVPVGLHRASGAWGEGTSDASAQEGVGAQATAGDATWTLRVFPATAWTTVGGDFATTPSASTTVGALTGPYTWGSTAALVADVQSWIAAPASNAGWMLLADESLPGPSAKRFNTRENTTAGTQPVLTVTYIAGGGPPPTAISTIPALRPIGLALLALCLAGFAAAALERRRA